MEFSVARRSAKDRPHDGELRAALLPAEPRHLHERGHVLRAQLRDHHAQHVAAQPQREGQALARAVRGHEPRHQQRRRPASGVALGELFIDH